MKRTPPTWPTPINDELRKWAADTAARKLRSMTPEQRAAHNTIMDMIINEALKIDWKKDV
jgi:hypothetical protein